MKKKWIIVAAIMAVVLVCALGGWVLASRPSAEPQPTPSSTPSETAKVEDLPTFNSTSPTPTATPSPTPVDTTVPTPEPSQAETVTKDEQGNETITPNWNTDKVPDNANIVPRQPEANMGGAGGGKIPTGDDGKYHGDQPSPAPSPSTPAPPSSEPSTAPSTPPAVSSPSDIGGPPSRNGYNGEKSGDYTWFDGFGWIIPEPNDGGEGGNDYDPDAKLSGEKIGEM